MICMDRIVFALPFDFSPIVNIQIIISLQLTFGILSAKLCSNLPFHFITVKIMIFIKIMEIITFRPTHLIGKIIICQEK